MSETYRTSTPVPVSYPAAADEAHRAWLVDMEEAGLDPGIRSAFIGGWLAAGDGAGPVPGRIEVSGELSSDDLPVAAFEALLGKFERLLLLQDAARIKVEEHPTRERLLGAVDHACSVLGPLESMRVRRLAGL
jgi:hypothetical protein